MTQTELWKFIKSKLENHLAVILMTVVQTEDSSPGKAGFKMAIAGDGSMIGTIGGGSMEYQLVETARFKLAQNDTLPLVKHLVHQPEAKKDRSGMICSGEQTVILYPITIEHEQLFADLKHDQLPGEQNALLFMSPKQIRLDYLPDSSAGATRFQFKPENDWQYQEFIALQETVYIVGSGHVGLVLSQVLSLMDLKVVALDHRPDVDSFVNNTVAAKILITDYDTIGSCIPDGAEKFVIIMTSSHEYDYQALKQLVKKNFKYLGLLGSKNKVKTIFERLTKEGLPVDLLNRVHAPVGIPIPSHTPAEIAISIAAEIIQVRNKKGE